MHNNLKCKTIWKLYYLARSYKHWVTFTKCSHISVTFSVMWDCWHHCQVFFSLNETFSPIQAVWKTSIVYIVIKTDGVKKSTTKNQIYKKIKSTKVEEVLNIRAIWRENKEGAIWNWQHTLTTFVHVATCI